MISGNKITVSVKVNASLSKVWDCWTNPESIKKWNFASDDWYCPKATNNLIAEGKFSYTMASKDGSMSFDFEGVYDEIKLREYIGYTTADDRKVEIKFEQDGNQTTVTEVFEAENVNSKELQEAGWQAILNNFKLVAEQ